MTHSKMSDNLTGGDGIPREQGGSFPESLFLLRPENLAYLNHEIERIHPTKDEVENRRSSLIVISILSPFFCGICSVLMLIWNGGTVTFLEDNTGKVQLAGYAILIVFIWVVYLIPWWCAWIRRSTLTKKGILLIGQVASAKGEWKIRNRVNYYFVTVSYRVRLPDETVLHGEEMAICMDMVGKPLPERGTPVAVVYVDEYTKRML